MRRTIAIAAAIASLSGGLVLAVSSPAAAVGGNCSGWSEKKSALGPDLWRIAARCSSLQADSKARGYGEADGPDHYTSWFTALNTTKYGAWGRIGIDQSSVQIARV